MQSLQILKQTDVDSPFQSANNSLFDFSCEKLFLLLQTVNVKKKKTKQNVQIFDSVETSSLIKQIKSKYKNIYFPNVPQTERKTKNKYIYLYIFFYRYLYGKTLSLIWRIFIGTEWCRKRQKRIKKKSEKNKLFLFRHIKNVY